MGVGDPLSATYKLVGPIAAGAWHLVGDGLILASVDMQFDVLWRSGGNDQPIVSFSHHFDVPAESYYAAPLDADAAGAAVPARAGDLLVLRITALSSASPGSAYIPNFDGSHTKGRIPALSLP